MVTADVKPIDELSAGRIMTVRTLVVYKLLTVVPLLFQFAGIGLAAAAWWAFADHQPGEGHHPLGPPVGRLLIAIGFLVAVAASYWGLRNTPNLSSGWYLRGLARREIKSHPAGIVDPDDPEAIFVEIVPRQNWNRLMLDTATDVGFLHVEETRREVLFEGDRERIRIPVGAILSCDVEESAMDGGTGGGIKYYFTVIRAQYPSGIGELSFAYRGDWGVMGAEVRKCRALTYRDRIRSLRS
jgi:hypothetical protein